MVTLVENNRRRHPLNFDSSHIYETLTRLKNKILSTPTSDIDVAMMQNFSNFLELAIGDDPMFCFDLMFIPSEFYDDLINVMLKLKHHKVIGCSCMKFVCKYLSACSNLSGK
jgi:hypothetical protein